MSDASEAAQVTGFRQDLQVLNRALERVAGGLANKVWAWVAVQTALVAASGLGGELLGNVFDDPSKAGTWTWVTLGLCATFVVSCLIIAGYAESDARKYRERDQVARGVHDLASGIGGVDRLRTLVELYAQAGGQEAVREAVQLREDLRRQGIAASPTALIEDARRVADLHNDRAQVESLWEPALSGIPHRDAQRWAEVIQRILSAEFLDVHMRSAEARELSLGYTRTTNQLWNVVLYLSAVPFDPAHRWPDLDVFWRATDERHRRSNSLLDHSYSFLAAARNAFGASTEGADGPAVLVVSQPNEEEVQAAMSPEEARWWGRFCTKIFVPVYARNPGDEPRLIAGAVVVSYETRFEPAANPAVWCTVQTLTALAARASELLARSQAPLSDLLVRARDSDARAPRLCDPHDYVAEAVATIAASAR